MKVLCFPLWGSKMTDPVTLNNQTASFTCVCVCEKKKDKYVNLHLLREEVWIHLDTAHDE